MGPYLLFFFSSLLSPSRDPVVRFVFLQLYHVGDDRWPYLRRGTSPSAADAVPGALVGAAGKQDFNSLWSLHGLGTRVPQACARPIDLC